MVSTRVTKNAKQEVVDIVGGSTFGKYSKISAAKTFNCYLTDAGIEGETKEAWFINFPGYQRVLNIQPYPDPYPDPPLPPDEVPVGEGRGLFHSIRGNIVIAVVNRNVYSLSPTLGQTFIGAINTSSGEVVMAENLNSQICIVDGQDAWIYDYSQPAPNLNKQTSGALGSGALIPNYVEYHNTFFLFGNANTGPNGAFWYVYQFNTAGSPPLTDLIVQVSPGGQFALQTKADFALAVKRIPARSSNVLVMGTTVCEVWTQVAGTENYTKNPSLSINYGCQSVSTIAEGWDILVWLGINEDESPVISVYDGDSLKNISTDGIDSLLGTIVAPQTSTAMLYREDGHLFYILTFYDPRDNLTLMYDFNTQLFFNLTNQDMDFYPARAIVYFNLKTYFISLRNAALYELSPDITVLNENLPRTSASSPYNPNLVYDIQRRRITSNIRLADASRFIVNSLALTLEQGCDPNYPSGVFDYIVTEATNNPADDIIITELGDPLITETSITVAGYVPRIDLAFSKDGGITWSNFVSRNLHPLGHRQNILHWEGMGVANDICFMFNFWQTNRLIVNNALLDIIP